MFLRETSWKVGTFLLPCCVIVCLERVQCFSVSYPYGYSLPLLCIRTGPNHSPCPVECKSITYCVANCCWFGPLRNCQWITMYCSTKLGIFQDHRCHGVRHARARGLVATASLEVRMLCTLRGVATRGEEKMQGHHLSNPIRPSLGR